jgi:hypothetical protein
VTCTAEIVLETITYIDELHRTKANLSALCNIVCSHKKAKDPPARISWGKEKISE